jgi:hypothetical protein
MSFKQNRTPGGRFASGNSANPGGLSRRQSAVLKLIEGLTPKAIRRLEAALDHEDPKIYLEAAKEIIKRATPNTRSAPSVNVAVNNVVPTALTPGLQDLLAVATRRKLLQNGKITEAEYAALSGSAPTDIPALPAPSHEDVIDVQAEEVDELDRVAAELGDDEDE